MSGHRYTIFVYCSFEPGFHKLLEYVRAAHPEAHITAVFPAAHELTENEQRHIDHAHYSRGVASLAGELRAKRMDEFIVQFESIKLRLFAIFIRPGVCTCWLGNGQLLPLSTNPVAALADFLRYRAKGYGQVLYIAFLTHVLGFASEPPERKAP